MTIKPSDMKGAGISSIAAVTRDHQKKLERERIMFETSKEQVADLFDYFLGEVTDSHSAAATLALATVMNLEESD